MLFQRCLAHFSNFMLVMEALYTLGCQMIPNVAGTHQRASDVKSICEYFHAFVFLYKDSLLQTLRPYFNRWTLSVLSIYFLRRV